MWKGCCDGFGGKASHGYRVTSPLFHVPFVPSRPFGPEAAAVAVQAFLSCGKGCGHPAQLNFGDCISYAMSKTEAMPLLFKGDDFGHTDVERVL